MSLFLARTGPPAMSDLSPLSGVERKLDFGDVRAAVDPTATLASHDENTLDTGFCPIKAFAFAAKMPSPEFWGRTCSAVVSLRYSAALRRGRLWPARRGPCR